MNHKRSIIAVPVLAVTAVVIGSAEATAKDAPDPDRAESTVIMPDPGPPNYPAYELPAPTASASVDDTATEALQASASALGGASLALAGVWVYRRRRIHAT
jgi:hypothetical protein